MNKELMIELAKAIESMNKRISALEGECQLGRSLINSALNKKTKTKSKKQSGAA